MNAALRSAKERIAAINERVEDSLSGIRVVKSFANEALEVSRFDDENVAFLATRRFGYKAEAYFSVGLGDFRPADHGGGDRHRRDAHHRTPRSASPTS